MCAAGGSGWVGGMTQLTDSMRSRPRPLVPTSRHVRAGRRARRRRVGVVVLAGAVLAPASLALADTEDDCVVNTAAFPPGVWSAQSTSFIQDISDGFSNGFLEGNIGFALTVGNDGEVTGEYVSVLTGTLEDVIDLSSANAIIVQQGQATGTGALVQVDGTAEYDIDANIDVAGRDGRDLMTGGHLLFEHHADFVQPYATQITPSFVNCGEAIGNLSSDPSTPILFIATRVGAAPEGESDIASMTVDFLDQVDAVRSAGEFDPTAFGEVVIRGEAIDALLAAQEYCKTQDLGSLAPGGSVRDLTRETLAETLYTFSARAAAGEYSVATIISVYATAIRGAMFGGPAGSCVVGGDPAREGLKSAFEHALIERYYQAQTEHNSNDMTMIRVAALQYGMTAVTNEIGFN
jgi:hypothetical protein